MTKIVMMNEKTIDEYDLPTVLGRSRERLLEDLKEDYLFNLIRLVHIEQAREQWVSVPLPQMDTDILRLPKIKEG